ncbi:T9SS type A sorting domain-containing protein [Hymenobacter baengnokdamensis]|uniref:T9SS type A sorting domain-containing protein n=1 Tax=Hymenobacter baengnokdamensis TaxID=2615203 RepID=UPI00124700FE|nr:T9SS type A sorting domain-containing protein [Hymenobacter baengnokdamensis]
MRKLYFVLTAGGLVVAGPAFAQDLTNAGATLTVQPGAVLYVGTGGLSNQAGSTLTNAGTLRTDGGLTNAGTLDLNTGTLEARGDLANTGTLLPGTSVVTFSGPANQLLTPGGASLYQVVVNKPTAGANTLQLGGSLTVLNQLTLTTGLVNTQNGSTVNTLSLPDGASVSGEASGRYVLGALQVTRNAVSGSSPVDFSHGVVLNPQGNSLGAVSITRTAGLLTPDVSYGQNVGGTSKGIDRIWAVVPTSQPSSPVQLSLSWLADDNNGLTDLTTARAWQQPAVGQMWRPAGPVTDASSSLSVSATPTVLNRFTVSNAANPLPVTLVDFTAQAQGPAAVRLNWTTASELNNVGFTVERSLDGHVFAAIGTVAGAGTSSTAHTYNLVDNRLPAGATLLYYRLGQTDGSGEVHYSPVRTVALTAQAAGFVVYPTHVAVGQVATYLYTGPTGPATLHVFDVLGRSVLSLPAEGRAQGEVPLAGLAAGAYVLRYTTATASFTSRCVVE